MVAVYTKEDLENMLVSGNDLYPFKDTSKQPTVFPPPASRQMVANPIPFRPLSNMSEVDDILTQNAPLQPVGSFE